MKKMFLVFFLVMIFITIINQNSIKADDFEGVFGCYIEPVFLYPEKDLMLVMSNTGLFLIDTKKDQLIKEYDFSWKDKVADNGNLLLHIDKDNKVIQCIEVFTGKRIWESELDDEVYSTAISHDSKIVAVGIPKYIVFYDILTGEKQGEIYIEGRWSTKGPNHMAFMPDNDHIIFTFDAYEIIQLVNVENGKVISTFILKSPSHFEISTDGNLLAIGSFSEDKIYFWKLIKKGKLIRKKKAKSFKKLDGYSFNFSNDGKYIAVYEVESGETTMKIYETETWQEINSIIVHFNTKTGIFYPDNQTIAVNTGEGKVNIVDVKSGKLIKYLTGGKKKEVLVTVIQKGHSFTVQSLSFSPDGKYIATAGYIGQTAKLWEVSSGREIRSFKGHTFSVNSVCFSPDGNHIATGGYEGTAKLWDISSGKEIRTFTGHSLAVNSVCFSPDGKYIITGSSDNIAKLWEVSTGKEIHSFGVITGKDDSGLWDLTVDTGINSVCFSSDGKYIAVGYIDKTAKLWEVSSGKEIHSFIGHTDEVTSVNISTDGKYLATGSYDDTAKLWDLSSGREIRSFIGHSGNVNAVGFSLDGMYLLTCSSDKTAKLWQVSTGKEVLSYIGHSGSGFSGEVVSLSISPDGKYIATGSSDLTAKLWAISTGKEIRTFKGLAHRVESVCFSPDEKYISIGSGDNTVKLWELTTGRQKRSFIGHSDRVISVNFSNDGKYLVTGSVDKTAKVWEVSTGKEIHSFTHSYEVKSVAFSPDGKHIATGIGTFNPRLGEAKIWDISSGREIHSLKGHNDIVASVCFSPNGRYLATGDWDNKGKLWEVSSGREILSLVGAGEVSFSPNGKYLATTGSGHSARLYDVSTGKRILFFKGHSDEVDPVCFSPGGKYLVTGSWDNTAKLWDNSGTEIRSFKHSDWVTSVSISLDEKYLITGCKDRTVKLWDIETGQELITLITVGENDYVVLTPDGYYSTSRGAIIGVHFVEALNIYTFENFDLIFNRPDIVAERIGKADETLIQSYKKAYLKRLKKMGFTEDQISTDMHLPEVEFVNKDFPFETKDKNISFQIKASDSKYKLDRINVYVNDVPISGVKGVSLRGQNLSEVTKDFYIELSNGKNKVQVSVHNEKGAESLKETFEIIYNGPITQPDLYVVAIGVSDYFDDDYDLTYASKDADDLATLFENEKGKFGNVNILRILDKNSTKENILNVKGILMQTKVDDEVILFIAGHGLLDENLDYYFATTDIDFGNPSIRGLPYEEIEGLLDGIPARKKLLLMDTCHSGEVDKEETEVVASTSTSEGTIKTRSFRGLKLKSKESSLGLQNSFELLQELFADLRRGSGAMVISSASGREFALESEQWKNGVFTYSVLEGLKTNNADKNNDNEIRISELRDYVIEKVQELTNGRQTPTSRRENLEFDFVVY